MNTFITHMTSPTLTSNRLTIRPFNQSDAELWQVWDIDPEVQAHMPEPLNEPENIQTQLDYIAECEAEEDGSYWSIENKEGVTIGTVALTDINNHHGVAEIGIVIGNKNYRGQGYGAETIQLVIDYAFNTLRLRRVSAEVEEKNVGAVAALQAAGFVQDGLFESARVKNGERINVIHLGMVA